MVLLFASAVVLLIAAVVLRSAHPKRAAAVAATGVIGALAGLALFIFDTGHVTQTEIPIASLALSDVVVTQDRYGQQLSGRVQNASGRRIGTLTLTVTYRQCDPDGACRVTGQESPRLFLALPPGQTGGFSTLLSKATAIKPAGSGAGETWDCVIASAEADF